MAIAKKKTQKKVSKKAATKSNKKKTTKKTSVKSSAKSNIKKTAKKVAAKKTTAKKTGAKAAKKTSSKKANKPVSVASKKSLNVGDKVPNFVSEATMGQVSLEGLKGKKAVIYFYPKDHTSGCTVEGHDFSKALPKFKAKNVEVYGVSRDSIESHKKFIEKQSYTIDLISDPEEKLCHLFGVMKEKSLYGRKYIGVDRSTFLIDEKGVITHVWRNVKVPGHVDEVLKVLD